MSVAVSRRAARSVEHARNLATAIESAAVSVRDGSVTWINPPTLAPGRSPKRLDPHLYAGITGIALFLAAASRSLEGQQHLGELAQRALSPLRGQLRRIIADPEKAATLSFSLGMTNGLAGYVYAFARIGHWLNDDELLAEAHAVARLITPERIAADGALDVFNGSAGALLALLALDRIAPDDTRAHRHTASLEALANRCGEHLIARHETDTGGWAANGKPPWCGWAHGVAGMAYALASLAQHTGHPGAHTTATDALAFERRQFDEIARNWPDSRFQEPNFIAAICHGAPGIALGRMGMLDAVDDQVLRREITDALATTRDTEEADLDFVCCGNIGRAEVLFEAARRGIGSSYDDHAWTLTERTLDRTEDNDGRFRWFEAPHSERFSPSFFSGAAGVGYTLLRLATDEPLPCLLMME